MKTHFSSFGDYTIAEATITESQISGYGNTTAPMLLVPVDVAVLHPQLKNRDGLELVSLRGILIHSDGSQIYSEILPINRVMAQQSNIHKQQHHLWFPITERWLSSIENQRNGGDVKFRVDLILLTTKLIMLNDPSQMPMVWGYSWTYDLRLQNDLIIPRETWISQVLPRAGYGNTYILEFPVARIDSCQALGHSFKALQQATERHKLGEYDDAVGKCRVAIGPFFEEGEDKKPVLKKSWEKKLGAATYTWLNTTLSSIKDAANVTHHSPNAHYSQMDSQMILAITTAVVAYIIRTFKPEEM